MQPELIIVIVSGFITLLASLFVAMYQSRVEFRKLASQLEEKYTTSLFDKRLEVYPLLFKALNTVNSSIEQNCQSKQLIMDFQDEFENWLSLNAIFLTPATANIIWGYHNYLIDLGNLYGEADIPEERWVEIRNIQVAIGKFLRAELGVYDMEPAGTPELEKPHVKEVLDKLDKSSDKIRKRFGY